MSSVLSRSFVAATALALSGIAVHATDPPAAAAAQGDLWEVTSQMTMEGVDLPIPPQKLQVCSPTQWTRPPAPADERQHCTNSDFRTEGPKATWKVTCAGPPAMTGEGEITRSGADDYSGSIKFSSEGGNMTIRLTGHRSGPCDNPQS